MLLLTVFIAIATGLTLSASAQQGTPPNGPVTPFQVGTITVNGGIGIGTEYNGDYYNSPFGLKAAVEYGVWQAGPGLVSLGGEIGGSFSNGGYQDYSNYKSSTVVVAARAAWHFGWEV